MKKLIFTILGLFSITIITAQDFSGGLLLGICGSQIDGDDQFHYKKPGLIIGAFVKRPFSEKAGLKIETYYIGKGAVKNDELSDGSVLQIFNTTLHYIEMPFLFDYQLLNKISVSVGIAPSYLFAHRLTSYRQEVSKNDYTLKSFDIQPMGQLDFYLTDHISASLRLSYSAFDIRTEAVSTWYNNNLSLVLRYKIK
jgi:hypothetical protein